MTEENKPKNTEEPRHETPAAKRDRRLREVRNVAVQLHADILKHRETCLTSPLFGVLHTMQSEINSLNGDETLPSASDMMMETLDRMLPDTTWFEEKAIVRRAHGTLITQAHSWFVVEIPGEEISDPTPWWRYIIDPAVPDTHPQCLLIGPGSPIQLAYRDQQDVKVAKPVEAGEEEG